MREEYKCCNAIREFPNGKNFVMCELEEGHEGEHQGLNFLWIGEGITKASQEEVDNGRALFGLHVEAVMKGYYEDLS